MKPIYVVIKSCERPATLANLLADLARAIPHGLRLAVWDDASAADMEQAKAATLALGGTWTRRAARAGKVEAWRHHNDIYASLRNIESARPLFFFDDDMRLCDRFLERALDYWEALPADKATLHFMVDAARDGKPCWTGIRAHNINKYLRRTQWVDGSFLTSRRMLEAIDFTIEPIDPGRHKDGRSTGVGEQLSMRLHKQGLGLYQVRESLCVHVDGPSVYHERSRRTEPIRALRFVDGKGAAARLERREHTEASMASMPSREHALRLVVRALLPQVDVLRVYLNGFAKVPSFLEVPRVVVARSQEHGDRGDAGKFFWAEKCAGYQIICDDDLAYPPSYADRLITAIERYGRQAIVGYHGVTLKKGTIKSYYADRLVTHFSLTVVRDTAVHLLGTGTIGYHPDTLSVRPADFLAPNMADIWLGRLAQRARVPMIMLARAARFLTGIETGDKAIFERYRKCDAAQSEAINELGSWVIHGERARPSPPAPRQRGQRPRRRA